MLEALVQVNTTIIHGCRLHSIPGTSYLTAILRKMKVKMKAKFSHRDFCISATWTFPTGD